MTKGTATLADDAASRTPSPARDEVQRQIHAILASPSFHGSKRCQQFLEYVCGRALAGDAGALKERAVAIEVFGRHPDSGLGEDTIMYVSEPARSASVWRSITRQQRGWLRPSSSNSPWDLTCRSSAFHWRQNPSLQVDLRCCQKLIRSTLWSRLRRRARVPPSWLQAGGCGRAGSL